MLNNLASIGRKSSETPVETCAERLGFFYARKATGVFFLSYD
jgi:hypothetical protein